MNDVIVIGAGPVGLATAIALKRAGLDYLVIEKGILVNSIYRFPTYSTWFSYNHEISIGDIPFTIAPSRPTRKQALEYYRSVAESEALDIHFHEQVVDIQGTDGDFTVITRRHGEEAGRYHCRKVVIATGYYDNPNMLGVEGEDNPTLCSHYYTDPFPYFRKNVVVVGAGNSGIEAALDLHRHGARVYLVYREPEIEPQVKYWLLPDIKGRIRDGHIQAFPNTVVTRISKGTIHLRNPQGDFSIENDFVFLTTGFHPDYNFFRKIGLDMDDDGVISCNPETFETSRAGVHVIGSAANGKYLTRVFIKGGREQAKKVAKFLANCLHR